MNESPNTKMKGPTSYVAVRLSPEQLRQLDRMCRVSMRTRSHMLRYLIAQAFAEMHPEGPDA